MVVLLVKRDSPCIFWELTGACQTVTLVIVLLNTGFVSECIVDSVQLALIENTYLQLEYCRLTE